MYRLLSISFCLLFALSTSLSAQQYLEWIRQAEEGTSFEKIQRDAEIYYQNRDQGRGSGYRQYKRWEYLVHDRRNAQGEMVNFSRMNWDVARELDAIQKAKTRSAEGCQASWSLLAPLDGYTTTQSGYNPGLGRVNVIAFDPFDANTVYAGTPSGGLWKTTNQGGSWMPLTDQLPSLGVSGIVIHPSNPNLIYILTGDGDGGDTYCIGVLRSLDGGNTWEETGLTFGATQLTRGYKLAMQPGNPNVLLAATASGLFRTADAGETWSMVQEGQFVDVEFHPANPSIQYATTKSVLYRSTDGGATWAFVPTVNGLPSGETRVALAVSPANPDYVYVFAGPATSNGIFKGLYRSTDSGVNFSTRTQSPNVLGYAIDGDDNGHQSAYDLALAVDPDNAETVITGGVNVWRSEDGGQTMDISSHWYFKDLPQNGLQYTHADIHELVYNPVDGSLWCGSDGGIFASFDDGKTWEDRSSLGSPGLAITQYYRISSFPGSHVIIGGAQDNGSNRWAGGADIIHFDGADGMDCMIHPVDSMIQYHTRQNGSLRKSFNGGQTHFNIRPGKTSGYWVTPLAMDPNDPETIYAAYEDTIYRSTTGGQDWMPMIPALGVGKYRVLHIAPADPNVIYAAADAQLFVSQDLGASWANISSGITPGTITGIATDRDNAKEVWVTLAGYNPNSKVFYSSDAGASWTNVTGSLPNLPANCIVYDPLETSGDNGVYIGMDVGVFYRDSSMEDWLPYFTGLPHMPVFDLEVHAATGMLQAGTFGRGIWETPLYQTDETAPVITCPGPQTASLNADCALIVADLTALAIATDNCDPHPEILQSPVAGELVDQDTLITLTVVDLEGNEAVCSFPLHLEDTTPPALSCPDDILLYSCEGTVEYSVAWEDNCTESTGELLEGLPSGAVFPADTTQVTWSVSDANGNSATCTFTVIVIDNLNISAGSEASCPGEATGTATVEVLSGAPPFAFLWDDPQGQAGASAENLAAGTYTVWVTDSLGCTGSTEVTVEATPEVVIVVDTVIHEMSSLVNGAIEVTVTGGVAPLSFRWFLAGAVFSEEEDLTGLAAGDYVLEVTDANGCLFYSGAITVDNNTGVREQTGALVFRVYPNPAGDRFWIEWSGEAGEGAVAIVDITGRVLRQVNLTDSPQLIEAAGLPSGMYLVRLMTEQGQGTGRMVISR
ncbi:MAG: HYR domain-containing protein [Lewinellaceae bacterium]|nr:HYR domain-containing protein [Lewinellaceae bacterium]